MHKPLNSGYPSKYGMWEWTCKKRTIKIKPENVQKCLINNRLQDATEEKTKNTAYIPISSALYFGFHFLKLQSFSSEAGEECE